jgi:hypothetical protein
MSLKAKALLAAVGSLIASALIAVWAKAERATPDDAPPAGSQPDPVDDFDPTPPDQLTPEQLAAGTSGKITSGTALGWNGIHYEGWLGADCGRCPGAHNRAIGSRAGFRGDFIRRRNGGTSGPERHRPSPTLA